MSYDHRIVPLLRLSLSSSALSVTADCIESSRKGRGNICGTAKRLPSNSSKHQVLVEGKEVTSATVESSQSIC
jgi:hypothetical protein